MLDLLMSSRRATVAGPHLGAMMKTGRQPWTYLAVHAIDAGIQNVLFADLRTVDDVVVRARGARGEPRHRRRPRREAPRHGEA
jgi:hypothetical protein